jgi:di/tricarboxylate transporter
MVLVQHVISSAAAAVDSGGDVSWGTLLMFVAGFVALAVVSSLGFIARIRDRANERSAEAGRAERRQTDAPSSTG